MTTNRMAGYGLLLILLLIVLEYAWINSPNERGKGRRRGTGIASMRGGCPSDPGTRKNLGAVDSSWTLRRLDGSETTFEEFRGKPVFINVWATWCGPCVDEMPDIQALWESLHAEGVGFILVSEESLDEVAKFVKDEGLTAPVYISKGPLPEVLESNGIPATFLVDTEGTVVHRRVGAAGWNNDACRNFLRELKPGGATPGDVSSGQ